MNHTGVYYNMDGRPALEGYLLKIQENDIPSAYFDPVADIDEVSDLGHAISCMKSIREAAKYQPLFVPRRTLAFIEIMGITVSTPPNENHDPRDYLDGDFPAEQADDAESASRIAEGMNALKEERQRTFGYERGKYE